MSRRNTEETWSVAFDGGDYDVRETLRPETLAHAAVADVTIPTDGLVLGRLLGEGGMGQVLLASQGAMRREVAVKQLKPGALAKSARSLLREAWVTGALEHPNIVPVHDVAKGEDGLPQIVLKRIEGTEWQSLLDGETPLPADSGTDTVAWHIGILIQVCNALEFAHDKGIIHRDLKPENVMVGSYGEVYVLDWGIAMALSPDPRGRFPVAGDQRGLMGTPLYMAPEMFKKDVSKLAAGTDIYMLAGMLYRVVSGMPPRSGDSLEAMFEQSQRLPPFDELWPTDLVDLLKASMQLDISARPSAADFRRELRAHLERRGLERLYRHAAKRFSSLCSLIAAPPKDPEAHHIAVHDAVGAIQFGLQEVLSSWPEHPHAPATQRELFLAMAKYETARGDGRAARVWLGNVTDPPQTLSDAVEALVQRSDADRKRLNRLDADLDRGTGFWARALLLVALAGVWVGLPAVLGLAGWTLDYPRAFLQYGLSFVVVTVGGVLFWRPIRASRTNRGLIVLVLLSCAFSMLSAGVAWAWDLDVTHSVVLKAMCDSLLVWVGALLFEPFLLPAGWVYVCAAALGVWMPEWANVISRCATLFLVCNALVAWPFISRRTSTDDALM